MNTKVRKTMKMAAAAVFILALAVNVTLSFSTPFELNDNIVLATGTNGDTGQDSGPLWNPTDIIMECGETSWVKTEYYSQSGDLVGTLFIRGGIVKIEYHGTYSYIIKSSGTTDPVSRTARDCPSGWVPFCTPTNPCKEV